jgi:hypothetical protein
MVNSAQTLGFRAMPARTNAFQRMIRAIQGHVSRTGSVTESKFLADLHTGSSVEVDIVIEDCIGGHAIVVGIECTAGRRRATVEWYREMRAKHADLPISKTVLVSKTGFTREVIRKASTDNIVLLTLNEAESFAWKMLLKRIKGGTLANVGFTLRSLTVRLKADILIASQIQFTANTVIHGLEKDETLGFLIMSVARDSGITTTVMSDIGEILRKTDHFSFSFQPPSGAYICAYDEKYSILEIEAVLTIHPKFQHVSFNALEFNGETIAVAAVPGDFFDEGAKGDSVVTISEDHDGEVKVKLLAPGDKDIDLDVFQNGL